MSKGIRISVGQCEVLLPGVRLPISVSASAPTENKKGESTVRFLMEGDDAMGSEPFRTLTEWHADATPVSLLIDDLLPVSACLLRECSLSLASRRLSIQVYTPVSAQQLRHWFGD